ncbi:MAG: FAD-binding oxidoreductase, partial [Nocardioidaceae bacterium]
VDQRPAAVAYPANADEVATVVRAAADAGLRVAPQGSGHGAAPLGPLDDTVLLRTTAMTNVHVDAANRRARAEGGALWIDVVEAAAPAGLATLHGSSPDVSVIGYSLGGGIGWYARKLGMQTNSITAVELVTADGSFVRAEATSHAELFWALRGGGGNFGVVTAVEFDLYPIESTYAGFLLWDIADAEPVLRRWAEWTTDAPDEVTTAFRTLNLPPMPELPEFLRGRRITVVDGAVLDTDERAGELLAGLRELRPEMDTFGRKPVAELSRMHMDPEGPTPAVSDNSMLRGMPPEAVDAFLTLAGPDSQSGLLVNELRQLGGALERPAADAGALPMLDGAFMLFGVAIAPTPEAAAQGHADADALTGGMAAYRSGRNYLNFAENRIDVRTGYDDEAWERLTAVRAAVDPTGMFVANHPIPGR